jgi:hypothetical protein
VWLLSVSDVTFSSLFFYGDYAAPFMLVVFGCVVGNGAMFSRTFHYALSYIMYDLICLAHMLAWASLGGFMFP